MEALHVMMIFTITYMADEIELYSSPWAGRFDDARQHALHKAECRDDEAAFDAALAKIAKAKPDKSA